MTHTIGIIGGGIVGATAAYYLSRQGQHVTVFEYGIGQATSASAGIICPWFSLRRNKPWYHLVSNGAEQYRQLMYDLAKDGFDTQDLFQSDGALLIRKNEMSLERDKERGAIKRETAPAIGNIQTVRVPNLKHYFPLLESEYDATFVEGGGRVDGRRLIDTLHSAIQHFGSDIIREKVSLQYTAKNAFDFASDPSHIELNAALQQQNLEIFSDVAVITSNKQVYKFDKLLLAAGAWLPELLTPLGFKVDIHPQKGQLFSIYHDDWRNQHWPVVMPPGKFDIIPFNSGEIVIGATHENDQDYDLTIDPSKLQELYEKALPLLPVVQDAPHFRETVGTRAYTSDYAVLLGKVPTLQNVWAVSGLGSSGLTSGPYIGHEWAQLMLTGNWRINEADFPIERYIQYSAH